jgi:hypothetical protein
MTAVIVATQREAGCVHIVTDAAYYTREGVVESFASKAHSVAHWPGAVMSVGNGAAGPLFGWHLAQEFRTFDDLVAGIESALPSIALAHKLPSGAELIFAGVSKDRGPEAYACRTDDDSLPLGMTREEAEASLYWAERPFKVTRLGEVAVNPVVDNDTVIAAHFEGVDLDGDTETVMWGLRKLLTMQRDMKLKNIGIGGFGQCTTISSAGVVTRMLVEWNEDRVGGHLHYPPIDWARWHAENPKPSTLNKSMRLAASRKAPSLRAVS